jgi:DNA mismatch repair ATPase MutS
MTPDIPSITFIFQGVSMSGMFVERNQSVNSGASQPLSFLSSAYLAGTDVFESILFKSGRQDIYPADNALEPVFFADLNLDQLVAAIIHGKEDYNLAPFFYQPLQSNESVVYRQQVMADLDNQQLVACINGFTEKMRAIWGILRQTQKLHYHFHKLRWFLESVISYCQLIETFTAELDLCITKSAGFHSFKVFLQHYTSGAEFRSLQTTAHRIRELLSTVQYCLQIKGDSITVRTYSSETDYSEEVLAVFAKFKQEEEGNRLTIKKISQDMNHIEAEILDYVAKLFPAIFSQLDIFYNDHVNYIDETVKRFEREIQFYVSYKKFISQFQSIGLCFCLPDITENRKNIYCHDGFDLMLAQKLIKENQTVVCNDYYLTDHERVMVITGPNQGGKTTFARMVGQLNHLGSLGCPIPGRDARVFLFDRILTHFERQENVANLRGKLQDDLIRINEILNRATARTLIIMNEIFTSTTSHDAIYLGTKIIEKIIALEATCVCVTFIDELTALNDSIVSMMSMIDDKDHAHRSFKVCRKSADGLAYSRTIVEKYHLTYSELLARIPV